MFLSQTLPYGPQPQTSSPIFTPFQPLAPIPYRPGYVAPSQGTQNLQTILNSLPGIIGAIRPGQPQQQIAPGNVPPTTTTRNNTMLYVLGGAGLLLGAYLLTRKKIK